MAKYLYKLKSYQGVITKKEEIQKRFEEKISNAREHGIIINDEWNELNILLNYIFNAFTN